MPAVQWTFRGVDRDVDIRIAASAKDDLLATRLVHWSITDDPRVGGEQIFMPADDLDEMRRSGFFLAIPARDCKGWALGPQLVHGVRHGQRERSDLRFELLAVGRAMR